MNRCRPLRFPLAALGMAVLTACLRAPPSPVAADCGSRENVQALAALLPPQQRENLIVIDAAGGVSVARPELRSLVVPMRSRGQNSFTAPNGLSLHLSPCDAPTGKLGAQSLPYSCFSEAGAAYRRLSSRDGFSYARANVRLPDPGTAGLDAATGAYVMLGGRSPRSAEVDAGLVYSPTHRWWTSFVRRENDKVFCLGDGCSNQVPPNRVRPGAATLEFQVIAPECVALRTNDGTRDYTVVVAAPGSGWAPGGAGQRLKRTTSLAGASAGDRLAGVGWRDAEIGTSKENAKPWADGQTEPGGACVSGNVTVRARQDGEDIDLAYP